jgi:hypothetical protein
MRLLVQGRASLKNEFKYGHFVDDAHLNAALQEDADRALADLRKRGVTSNGEPLADLLRHSTNKTIIDVYDEANIELTAQESARQAGTPPVPPMLGANGTQVTSKTLWNGDGSRIDVENPNPGQRPGQIHYQDATGKYIYDINTGEFQGMSATKNLDLLSRPEVQRAIQKGLQYLGVGQ